MAECPIDNENAEALAAPRRGRNLLVPLLLAIPCLGTLISAGCSNSSSAPALVAVPLKQDGMAAHQPIGADDWIDASTNAIQRGDVRVQIVSAQVGPVNLKQKSSSKTSAERCLTLFLRVSNQGIVFQQTPYEPWADVADSPSKHPPTLTDNQGRTYTQKTFGSGWKVVGRADVDALNPGHQVKEVLVYPVPPRDVEYLQLMLPGPAFGLAGEFRFQIPRRMIGDL